MRRPDPAVLAAFLVAIFILGANWVGVRFSNHELPPFYGAGVRFLAASAILFAVVALRGVRLPRGRALLGAVLYGLGQYFVTFALLYWALVEVPAGMTSVIFATLPLWTLFMSAAAGFERVRVMNVVGALIALAGLAVIFSAQLTADVPLVRVLAVLAAALAGGGVSVLVRTFPRTNPVATNAIGTLVGWPILLAGSLLLGERWVVPHQMPTWLALAYLVVATCVGFVLLVWVILRWTPSAAAYGAVAGPVVTIVLATLLTNERFGPAFFVGAVVVGAGVYLGALATGRQPSVRPAATAAD